MKSLKITDEAHQAVMRNAGFKQLKSGKNESVCAVASEMIIFADKASGVVGLEFTGKRGRK